MRGRRIHRTAAVAVSALVVSACGSEQAQGPDGDSLADDFATALEEVEGRDATPEPGSGVELPLTSCPLLDDRGLDALTTIRPDSTTDPFGEATLRDAEGIGTLVICAIEPGPIADSEVVAVGAGPTSLARDAYRTVFGATDDDPTSFDGDAPGLDADSVFAVGRDDEWLFVWVGDGFAVRVATRIGDGGAEAISPEQSDFGFRALSIAVDEVARTLRS